MPCSQRAREHQERVLQAQEDTENPVVTELGTLAQQRYHFFLSCPP